MKYAPKPSNVMLGPDNKKIPATLKHTGKTKKGKESSSGYQQNGFFPDPNQSRHEPRPGWGRAADGHRDSLQAEECNDVGQCPPSNETDSGGVDEAQTIIAEKDGGVTGGEKKI